MYVSMKESKGKARKAQEKCKALYRHCDVTSKQDGRNGSKRVVNLYQFCLIYLAFS